MSTVTHGAKNTKSHKSNSQKTSKLSKPSKSFRSKSRTRVRYDLCNHNCYHHQLSLFLSFSYSLLFYHCLHDHHDCPHPHLCPQSKPLSSFSQSAPTVSVSRARETISRKKEEKVGEQILKSSFLYFYKLSTTTLFISQVQTLNFGDVLFGSSRWMHLSTIKHIKKNSARDNTISPVLSI